MMEKEKATCINKSIDYKKGYYDGYHKAKRKFETKIEKLEAEIKKLKEQDDIRRSWENYEERMGS